MKKRLLRIILCVVMIMAYMPAVSFANDEPQTPNYVCRVTDANGAPINAIDGDQQVIDTDGKYETVQAAINVCPKTATVTKVTVEEVDKWKVGSGEPIYETEAEAKTAAKEAATCTVTMLKDYEREGINIATIAAGQVVIFDIAGHDITLKLNQNTHSSVLFNSGDLTIKDSKDEGADGDDCGCLTAVCMDGIYPGGYGSDWQATNYTTSVIRNEGTCTLLSGRILNTMNGSICYGFDNLNANGNRVTLNIHGGKILSQNTAGIRFGNGVLATMNMDGGWVECINGDSAIWLQCTGKEMIMNISGGTIVGSSGVGYGIYDTGNSSKVHYNITGGTFSGSKSLYTTGANVDISGGTFNGDVTLKQNYEGTTLHISGGEFDGRVASYGAYRKTGFVYGGHFNGQKNYDTSTTYYFDENDLANIKYGYFTRMSDDKETKHLFKTYQEYKDAGYTLYNSAGVSGYLVDADNEYVLTDAEGNEWNYVSYTPSYYYSDEYKDTVLASNMSYYGSGKDSNYNVYYFKDSNGYYYYIHQDDYNNGIRTLYEYDDAIFDYDDDVRYDYFAAYYTYSNEDGDEINLYYDSSKSKFYDKDNNVFNFTVLTLDKYEVYQEVEYDVFEQVDTLYVKRADDYFVTDEEASAYLYEYFNNFDIKQFYEAGNYHSNSTLATYPNEGISDSGWGYIIVDNYTLANQLAYSSKYVYGGYYPATMVAKGYIASIDVLNLTNYWKKAYNTEYKGLYTDDSTGKVYKMYSLYEAGENYAIADDYTDKVEDNDTPGYYWVVPCEVELGKASVEEKTEGETTTQVVKVKGDEIIVDRTNGDKEEIEAESAADMISATLKNNTVSGFLDTNINTAVGIETRTEDNVIVNEEQVDVIKGLLKEEVKAVGGELSYVNDVIDKVDEAKWDNGDFKTRVDVDLKSTVVAEMELAASNATVTTATFDVKPIVKVTITDSQGAEKTYEAVIPNEEIKSDITFRLPVNKDVTSPTVKVYHSENKPTSESAQAKEYGDLVGFFPIQTSSNGDKFVELSAKEFSYYTYEILDIVNNSTVAIIDDAGNTRGFKGDSALADAVDSFLSDGNEDDLQIILLKDAESIDYDNNNVTINLNGYKLTGESENATNVTVVNENESKQDTLEATGVYKNDVSGIVGDGYDVKTSDPKVGDAEKNEVYKTTGSGVYKIEVTTETTTDRVKDNDDIDVFAGDYVSVTVNVNGARFVAADVTLKYDKDKFELVDFPLTMWEIKEGSCRFYNAKAISGYYEDGYTLGTFLFKAKALDANATASFTVSDSSAYVAGAWSLGWSADPENAIGTSDITDASANIILKSMTGSVTARTGLAYTATAQALLEEGYTAKDNTTGKAITDATIEYAYVTKTASEADGFDSSTLTYTSSLPAPTDAGDYVVFYNIKKAGYETVSSSVDVSIAKRQTTIAWKSAEFVKGKAANKVDNAGNAVEEDFYKTYADTAASLPIAEYDSMETNTKANATSEQLTVSSKPSSSDGTLKPVGSYTVTVDLGSNYDILNPNCTLLIDGALIEGYNLQNTDEGNAVWYDAENHDLAKLVKDESLVPTEDNVTIQYSLNGGAWSDSIPEVSEVGKYELEMKITADSYYDFTDKVNFEIKNTDYAVEKSDYVTGWDLVLVYTNDSVPGFKYNGKKMYDVSDLGYRHGTVWNATGTAIVSGKEGTLYEHVYAYVVFGDADITKVIPSNETAIKIDRKNTKNRYDVNNSYSVDIRDLVAVQATYNVDEQYLNDEKMSIVLRADVSGNKKVDTYDCSLIKLNTGK